MKKMLTLALAVLLLCSCTYQYYPFSAQPPDNCTAVNSDITIVNGVPSIEYNCTR